MKHAWKTYLESIALAVGGGTVFGWIARGVAELYVVDITGVRFLPADEIFTTIWGILYLLMGVSAARIYLKVDSEMRIYALKTYCWQLLFSWIGRAWLFHLSWHGFGGAWLLVLVVQVVWMGSAFRELDLLAAGLQIPYLVWLLIMVCSFAVELLG